MVYTVRRGDSLSKIASRFNVSLKSLIDENNLKSHMLMAEQRIKIPIKGVKSELKLIKASAAEVSETKRLALIKENKLAIVPGNKLEMVKVEKMQIAKAPASKTKIDFSNQELLKTPPAVKSPVVASKNPEPVKAEVKTAVADKKEKKAVSDKTVVTKTTPAAKAETVDYQVSKGDSLLKIAHRYNTTVAQIQHDNDLNGTMVKIGQKLKISPDKKLYRVVKTEKAKADKTKVVSHKVKSGESLSLIARKYKTTISSIVSANNMTSTVLMAGQTIKVPTSSRYKITQSKSKVIRGSWKMPVRGRLSDRYGWRNHPVYRKRLFHAGIDIAAPKGTPIAAAQSGKVIYAGRRSGYGKLVIISHANGYSSRYAHCSSILVKKGQNIKAGQLVARVGATGVATGNHLHFEIRKNGKTLNPLSYL
jgi:murein DD-endopeptidase MepM/ murein hydrolase activator NlpD